MTNTQPPTRVRVLTAFGETKRLADWSRDHRCRVTYATLYHRVVRSGWKPETAISRQPYGRILLTYRPTTALDERGSD
jgi:hypothetical protein